MFQFTSGIGFCVDVGNFLEFERAFQGNRVVQATPQEQGVLFFGKVIGPGHDLRLQRQHALQGHRKVAHGREVGGLFFIGQPPLGLGQCQRQQVQPGQLGGEGLGGGHANLYPSAGDVGQLAFAHHGTGGHVADGQRVFHAHAARVFEGSQRVGGFATLGDGDHQRLGVGHAVSVTVFAGNLNLAGHFGNGFQPVLGHAAAVVAGATGQNQHAIDRLEHVVGTVTKQLRRDGDHTLQRVTNCTGLLKNFFLHVMAVRPQLSRTAVGVNRFHRAL